MIPPVADARVWNSVRWLYVGSGVLFLANIALGILNVFSPGTLARGQVLSHFHAGSIGWITLGVIATTLWVFTGQREVSERYARFTAALVTVAVLAVAGYIAAFGLAFNGDAPYWLLPLFGIPTWLVVVGSMVFAWPQLKRQPVVTTVHLLLFGALLVASLGATMGVIWGLTYEVGAYPGPAAAEGLGAHAAPMDMYLALAFAGLVELALRKDDGKRWTKPGLAQMILGTAGGFIAALSLYTGLMQLVPLSFLGFLGGFGFYLARVGWRAFAVNPFAPGRAPALFWGGLAFPAYIIGFTVLVFAYFIPEKEVPHALGVAFVHVTFIGLGTNLLLATQSAYVGGASGRRRAEAAAFWALNLGMLAFFAGEFMAERREGALLMAVGVVASLLVVWMRLGDSWTPPEARQPPAGRKGPAARRT